MSTVLGTPRVDELAAAVEAVRGWQRDRAPMQLHSGDLGWFWRFGAEATAAAVRTWSRDGRIVAVGLLDGPGLIRLTTAPDLRRDGALAAALAADIGDPDRGVLPAGRVDVEAPRDAALHDLLAAAGWLRDEPWTPLYRDLTDPVPEPLSHPRADPRCRVVAVGPDRADDWSAVVRAGFGVTVDTTHRWYAMAAGPPFAEARCLLIDDADGPAAAITVWSAGPGRPGLIEPMAVHPDHRGSGHGRAICLAGAAVLRELGASSAIVCTRSANVGGVATYRSAGYVPQPEVRDHYRPD